MGFELEALFHLLCSLAPDGYGNTLVQCRLHSAHVVAIIICLISCLPGCLFGRRLLEGQEELAGDARATCFSRCHVP